jgi:NOL1/NOP2/fmu family ribosome biogenesis protein
VLSNEYVTARSKILAGNVERMGLRNVVVTNLDSKFIAEDYPTFFDLVVVDAPCSGEGMYRKNDNAISEWSVENVKMCAERQTEIIDNAAKTVAPGGYLLYSTCTYSTEENEGVVAAFLDTHPDFSICRCNAAVEGHTSDGIDITGGKRPELAYCRRFYPHVCRGEGQFAALLRYDGEAKDVIFKNGFKEPDKNDRRAAEDFMKETVGYIAEKLCIVGGNMAIFSCSDKIHLPARGLVAAGVTLGEVRKGRVVPHHHYFTAYGTEFLSKFSADPTSESVLRYISGEETDVPAELSGYTALLLKIGSSEITLGGGKAVGGRLKNYYPKGLRQLNLYR